MAKNLSQARDPNSSVLTPGSYGTYRSEVTAGFRWLIQLLEETERRNNLPRGQYDAPVQERIRRAS